jgi:hypothetical protein
MNRRDMLRVIAVASVAPFINGSPEKSLSMYVLELWTDSTPENFTKSKTVRIASAFLHASENYAGLFSLSSPLTAKLPSGLEVSITCERVPTGDVNCGVSHNGELSSVGKYSGAFTIRVFPPSHQSYILDFKPSEA